MREELILYQRIIAIYQELKNVKNNTQLRELYTEYLKCLVRLSPNNPIYKKVHRDLNMAIVILMLLDLNVLTYFINLIKMELANIK